MAKQYDEKDFEIITLNYEDGTEAEYAILAHFRIDEKPYKKYQYIAISPVDDEDEYADDLAIYRVVYDEDGEETLDYLESDKELSLAIDALRERLQAMGIEIDL